MIHKIYPRVYICKPATNPTDDSIIATEIEGENFLDSGALCMINDPTTVRLKDLPTKLQRTLRKAANKSSKDDDYEPDKTYALLVLLNGDAIAKIVADYYPQSLQVTLPSNIEEYGKFWLGVRLKDEEFDRLSNLPPEYFEKPTIIN